MAAAVRRRLKQVVGARLAPYHLTPQQFWVLLVLLDEGPLSLHPLSQRVWMDDPTASRVVKALVGQGLVLNQADPGHGRRILVSLAPAALPLARELQALAQEIKGGVAAGLAPEERSILRQGLLTLINNLDGMLVGARADDARTAGQAS